MSANLSDLFDPPKPRRVPDDDSTQVAKVVDEELGKLGWTPPARQALLGNLGRENNWNRKTIFAGHKDPANNADNLGIISWQKDRRTALQSYMRENGGSFEPTDDNLRLMARFMDTEMQGSPEWWGIHQRMRDPNLTTDAAYPLLQKYIKYQPRYEGANRKWTRRAQSLGLGRSTPNADISDLFEGGSNAPAIAPNQAPEASLPQLPPEMQADASLTRPRIAPFTTTADGEVRTDEFAPVSNAYRREQAKYKQVDTASEQAVEANRLSRAAMGQARREERRQRAAIAKQNQLQGLDAVINNANRITQNLKSEGLVPADSPADARKLDERQLKEMRPVSSPADVRRDDERQTKELAANRDALRKVVRTQVEAEETGRRQSAVQVGSEAQSALLASGYYGDQYAQKRIDDEVDKRVDAMESQQRRDAETRSTFTPAERDEIQRNIKAEGGYGDIRRGATTGFHRFLSTIDKIGAAAARIAGNKQAESEYRKRELAFREQSQDVEEQYPLNTAGKATSFITENVLNTLPVAAASASGNPVVGFAAYNALLATGEGKAPSEIIRDAAKGAATGVVFQAGGRLTLFPRVATVGLGTGVVEKAFGASDRDTLGASVTNALFAAFSGKDSLQARLGAKIRVWRNGKPVVDVENTKRGVRLLPPANVEADANVESSGKAGDGSLKYKLLNAAPTEGQGERISTPVPQPPTPQPVPETPETLNAQMQAMRAGTRDAVLVTPQLDGAPPQLPPIPPDYLVTPTSIGIFIHPKSIRPLDIKRAVRNGSYPSLLGIVDPNANLQSGDAVIAKDAQGNELQAAAVRPETANPQAQRLAEQFPQASIEPTTVEEVKATRATKLAEPKVIDEVQRRTTQRATERAVNLSRNFRAGTNDATMTFASPEQKALYDLAANEKYRMRGGQSRTSQRTTKDTSSVKASLAAELGISESEVINRAFAVHDDVRAQMKGVKHLEERRLVDNTQQKIDDLFDKSQGLKAAENLNVSPASQSDIEVAPDTSKTAKPERVGQSPDEYDGKSPDVDWDATDMYGKWSRKSVGELLSVKPDKHIYQAMVDLSELKPERVERSTAADTRKGETEVDEIYLDDAKRMLDDWTDPEAPQYHRSEFDDWRDHLPWNPEDGYDDDDIKTLAKEMQARSEESGYDEEEYQTRRSGFPPIVITRKADGSFVINDGNHRADIWGEQGHDVAPAWVNDEMARASSAKPQPAPQETVHHSTRQHRRVRNTKGGKSGQFKRGSIEPGQPSVAETKVKQPHELTKAEFVRRSDSYNEMTAAMRQGEQYPAAGDYSKMSPRTARRIQAIEAKTIARTEMERRAEDEARKELAERYPDNATAIEFSDILFTPETHRLLIERALRQGKPVSPEVLKDYPDLAPKTDETKASALSGNPKLKKIGDYRVSDIGESYRVSHKDNPSEFGMFGKKFFTEESAVEEFAKGKSTDESLPIWKRMRESSSPLSDRQRDVETERGRAIREQPTELTKADTAPVIRRAVGERPPLNRKKGEAGFINVGSLLIGQRKTPIPEVITAMRRAGLLTGIKTHLRNIVSNTAFQVSEEMARPFQVLADLAVSAQTKTRTVQMPSIASIARSAKAAGTVGVKEAYNVMRYGMAQPSQQQLNEVQSGLPLLDLYVNTVFRAMEAGDRIFKAYAYRRSLEESAKSLAITEKMVNIRINIEQRRQQLLANPTSRMQADATAYAEYATFQNKNVVSTKLNELKQVSPAFKFVFEQFVPFDKTPTNIVARVLEYSPLGIAQSVGRFRAGRRKVINGTANMLTNAMMTPEDQRAFAKTFGRGSLGTGILALGFLLAMKGLLAGVVDYDDDKDGYFARRAAAIENGSLKIPGTDKRIVVSGNPLGNILVLGASLYEQAIRRADTTDQQASRVAKAAISPLKEQPMIKAAEDYLSGGMTLGERFGAYFGSYVPTIVSDAGEVLDEKARKQKGFEGRLLHRVPELPLPILSRFNRTNLEEQRAPVGGYEERGNILRRAIRAADPLNTTTQRGEVSSGSGRSSRRRARSR